MDRAKSWIVCGPGNVWSIYSLSMIYQCSVYDQFGINNVSLERRLMRLLGKGLV